MPVGFPSPNYSRNRIKLSKKGYIKSIAIVIGFFIVIGMTAFEFRQFGNTFNISTLLIASLFLGIIVGVFIAKKIEDVEAEILERFQIYVFIVVLSIIVMPLLLSLTNRLLSFHDIDYEQVEFMDEKGYYSSRFGMIGNEKIDGYYIHFIKDGELYRVKSRKAVFPNAKKGDQVLLPVRKGLLGFVYFVE